MFSHTEGKKLWYIHLGIILVLNITKATLYTYKFLTNVFIKYHPTYCSFTLNSNKEVCRSKRNNMPPCYILNYQIKLFSRVLSFYFYTILESYNIKSFWFYLVNFKNSVYIILLQYTNHTYRCLHWWITPLSYATNTSYHLTLHNHYHWQFTLTLQARPEERPSPRIRFSLTQQA